VPSYGVNMEFEFSKLSNDDKAIAIFHVEEETPEELQQIFKARLRDQVGKMDANIGMPAYHIQIRREVNDGPIPGISLDDNADLLSCNWRQLFTAFYGEELLYNKLTEESLKEKEAWTDGLKAKVDRRELNPEQAIREAVSSFASSAETCRKKARRSRIRHQSRLMGKVWNFGTGVREVEWLSKLMILRSLVEDEAFSDEEGGGWETEEEGNDDEAEEEDEEEESDED